MLAAVTALIFYVYLSKRRVPLKYLLPGTLFLIAFQIVPVLYTMSTAFTNYGDGHRGSKQDAINSIQSASVKQVPGSAEYELSVATKGDPATGKLVFLLVDPAGATFLGDAAGLHPLAAGDVTVDSGRITAATGYTLLNLGEASARNDAVGVVLGAHRAGRGAGVRDHQAPTTGRPPSTSTRPVTASRTGTPGTSGKPTTPPGPSWPVDGQKLPQGWKVGVGFTTSPGC